jgi:ribosome-associated translation inhibitor RaiA
MQVPLQIKFRHMERSAIIEDRVRERCHKLQRFAEYVIRCRVIIDAPHKQQGKTGLYQATIEITLLDEQTGGSYHAEQQHAHQNVDVAIREVFDAAQHQLENYVRQQRAYMKKQVSKPHSRIA